MVRLENEPKETGGAFYAVWSRTHRRIDCRGTWHGERRERHTRARTGLEHCALSDPACRLLGPPISALRSLRRPPCRSRGAATGSGRASCGRRAAGHRPAAASGKLRRISLLERPVLRRCPLQQALCRPETVIRISARLVRVLEIILDLLHQQPPRLVLARAR